MKLLQCSQLCDNTEYLGPTLRKITCGRLDANCVVITRPFPSWPMTRVTRASRTVVSLSVRPGDRTLVESLMNRATPSLPAMQMRSLDGVTPY